MCHQWGIYWQLKRLRLQGFFSFEDFICLLMRDREKERGRDTVRGRSRLHAGEPDVGLDPGSPGSRPGLKAALNRWATRASPRVYLIPVPFCSLNTPGLFRMHSTTWMSWPLTCSPAGLSMLTRLWRKGIMSTSVSWTSRTWQRHTTRNWRRPMTCSSSSRT